MNWLITIALRSNVNVSFLRCRLLLGIPWSCAKRSLVQPVNDQAHTPPLRWGRCPRLSQRNRQSCFPHALNRVTCLKQSRDAAGPEKTRMNSCKLPCLNWDFCIILSIPNDANCRQYPLGICRCSVHLRWMDSETNVLTSKPRSPVLGGHVLCSRCQRIFSRGAVQSSPDGHGPCSAAGRGPLPLSQINDHR